MSLRFFRRQKPLKPARPQDLREGLVDPEARMIAANLAVSVNRRLGYDTSQEIKDIADGREWDPDGWAQRHPGRAARAQPLAE